MESLVVNTIKNMMLDDELNIPTNRDAFMQLGHKFCYYDKNIRKFATSDYKMLYLSRDTHDKKELHILYDYTTSDIKHGYNRTKTFDTEQAFNKYIEANCEPCLVSQHDDGFKELYHLLLLMNPNMTLTQLLRIQEHIECYEYTQYDYYDTHTDYKISYILFKDIADVLFPDENTLDEVELGKNIYENVSDYVKKKF